jgi:very-short-patch-repair endonuclease
LKIVIEIDGSVHNLKEVKELDLIRENDIKSFGIRIIRFKNDEIRNNIENVIDKLKKTINQSKTNEGTKEK